MNVRVVNNDTAAVYLEWTDDEVDNEDVFATFTEAKTSAVERCIPERDAWARMIQQARTWTRKDVI